MIQVNRIYLIFNRLVTKKFLVDTSVSAFQMKIENEEMYVINLGVQKQYLLSQMFI